MSRWIAVARALSICGKPSLYRLGAGGRDPRAESPLDPDTACDCSGFACWAVGLNRWWKDKRGVTKWADTLGIWYDARNGHEVFIQAPAPAEGDLLVFPDTRGQQGHVGVIVKCDPSGKVLEVAHCSNGNAKMFPGFAVQVTPPTVFNRRKDTIACRPILRPPDPA